MRLRSSEFSAFCLTASLGWFVLWAPAAGAQPDAQRDAPGSEAAPPVSEASEQASSPRQSINPILRGFYVETRVGGGYTVAQPTVEPTDAYPQLSGSEGYGGGVLLQLAVGYDITDFLAFEAIGGGALLAGTRSDRVRDLGLYFGGAGLRGVYDLSKRLKVIGGLAGAYATANNGVEAPESGPMLLASGGVEYFVHVRHFSVGLSAMAALPLSPLRAIIGLAPQIKYTF